MGEVELWLPSSDLSCATRHVDDDHSRRNREKEDFVEHCGARVRAGFLVFLAFQPPSTTALH